MAVLGAPMNGNSVLVEIDGTVVGSQTGVTFTESRETIDITDKQDLGVTQLKKGKYSATCSMTALFIDSDTAFGAIRTKMRSGATVTLIRQEPQGTSGTEDVPEDWYTATAIVTGMSEDFPQDSVATCSADFAITGEWAAV